jgi:hypothetical protein
MRLAVLGFLAALVAIPLAANAAEQPTRWAVTLSGRVVEEYSYGKSDRLAECAVSRWGTTTREWRVASMRPTVVSVTRGNSRARYRPARLFRVRLTTSVRRGSWMEMRQCLGETVTTSGRCDAKTQRTATRPTFAWGGANRIVFHRRPGGAPIRLCGFNWTVPATDAWLSVAPGRVDEEVLIAGSRRLLVARADVSRDTMRPFNPPPGTTQQKLRVVWTLRFRRLP